ncbi:response regulator [Candidatus Omnitrophota bacterium]
MMRILIVDDEVDICDFVKNFFRERNFDVEVAYSGKEAVKHVKARKPHIILLDIKMPEMDGLETLKAIRKIDDKIKVIMVTAVEDMEMAEETKNHGASEYITKPLLLEQLERTVFTIAEQIKMDTEI